MGKLLEIAYTLTYSPISKHQAPLPSRIAALGLEKQECMLEWDELMNGKSLDYIRKLLGG